MAGGSFKSTGNGGYTSNRMVYKGKRRNRRRVRKVRNFNKRVVKAVENNVLEKANFHTISTVRLPTSGAAHGNQYNATVVVQNSQADLASIYNQISVSTGATGSNNIPIKSFAQRYMITGYMCNFMMKSMTNTSQIVDLYFVVPRFDTANGPSTCFSSGFADQNASGVSANWGVTPYMSNLFTTSWKILSKRRVVLAPGASENIEYKDGRNYTVNYERINSNSSNLYYKGLTKCVLVIARGEPLNDSTTMTAISTSKVAVDFAIAETYYYTYAPLNNVFTTTGGSFGAIASANSQIVQGNADVAVDTVS